MKQFLLIAVAALIAIPSIQASDDLKAFGAVDNSNNCEMLIAKASKKKVKKVTNANKTMKAAKKNARKQIMAADKNAKKQIDQAYEKAYGKTGAKVVKKLTGYDKAMKQHDAAVKQSMKQLGY